jgi:hypothetical protein
MISEEVPSWCRSPSVMTFRFLHFLSNGSSAVNARAAPAGAVPTIRSAANSIYGTRTVDSRSSVRCW